MALRTERQSARMSKIKNGGLDQYGAGPYEHQQFGTAGVEGVNGACNESNDQGRLSPSGVTIQVASGAYAPPVSKIRNILVCDFSESCMYEDLRVKPTGMFVK